MVRGGAAGGWRAVSTIGFKMTAMQWTLRCATLADVPALEELIRRSVLALLPRHYMPAQLAAALGPAFGVDRQLIQDGSYFAVQLEGRIIGCGGWSRRRAVYGGDRDRTGEDAELDPVRDAARIRAFFVDPDWTRRGIGRRLLAASESAIRTAGFRRVELVATLAGEPLYAAHGYRVLERYDAPLPAGQFLPVVRMARELIP